MAVSSNNFHYNHASLEPKRRFLRFLIKNIGFTMLAKVDQVEGIENVPEEGSAILLINHIAFIDPIVVIHVLPRNIVPLAKIEVYDYPFVGIFPKIWEVVPIKRDDVDRRALQKAMAILRAGEIVLVAPEGTRHTELQQAREGIAYLASRTGAPVVPVAIDGTEGFPALRWSEQWNNPGAHLKFGKPFRFRPELTKARGRDLRLMTDEAMYLLASLLPEYRRGVYSNLSRATQETIEWVK
jgi:1-acyl-sn-glycerol-3-phosphate acyltransferase